MNYLTCCVVLAASIAATASQSRAASNEPIRGVQEFSRQIVVKPKNGRNDALQGLDVIKRIPALGVFVIRVPSRSSDLTYLHDLLESDRFEWAEPNWRVFAQRVPNDPLFDTQWHHARIRSARAWDYVTTSPFHGDPDIVVAIVDSGVNTAHPDLNCVPGYNAVSQLTQQNGGDVTDASFIGHGTRVAGVVGAQGDNGQGVAGMVWDLKIMPVRVTNDSASSPPYIPYALNADIAEGITWAAQHGADVINVSLGGWRTTTVQAAAAQAHSQGKHVVFAAGNDGASYPDGDDPNIIVVGSTDAADQRSSFSNTGPFVDCAAPGESIWTTSKSGGYVAASGTSFAAPMVSGTLALIRYYGEVVGENAERVLFRSCVDLGAFGRDSQTGHGRIDLFRALLVQFRYKIRPLATSFGDESIATSINDASEVAGFGGTNLEVPGERRKAHVWSGSTSILVIPSTSYPFSDFAALNRYRLCVGTAYDSAYMIGRPMSWSGTAATFLQGVDNDPRGHATCVSDSGGIGGGLAYGNPFVYHAVWWPNATAAPIPLLLGSYGLPVSYITSAYPDGSITGYLSSYDYTNFRGALWLNPSANPVVLPAIGAFSHGVANGGLGADFLVGGLGILGVDPGGAVVWKNLVPSWLEEPVSAGYTAATNAGDVSTIIGFYRMPGWSADRACVWQNGFFVDLFSIVDPTDQAHWTLLDARDINADGQIVGVGSVDGGPKIAYVATPVPRGSGGAAGLTVNCSVVLGDYAGDLATTSVDFELTRVSTGESLGTYTATRDPDTGIYSLATGSIRGVFRIRARASHWLARQLPEVLINDLGASANFPALINGDLDANNLIDSDDFDVLVAGFGIGSNGDLNGDGATDSDDFDILVKNFGQVGD